MQLKLTQNFNKLCVIKKNLEVNKMKDKNNKPILGGSIVMTPNGRGYVYQIIDGEVRVTRKPQTGLIGWFKPSELKVIRR